VISVIVRNQHMVRAGIGNQVVEGAVMMGYKIGRQRMILCKTDSTGLRQRAGRRRTK